VVGSGWVLFPVADCGISGVAPWGSATTVLIPTAEFTLVSYGDYE
jgi:hypothetical protein